MFQQKHILIIISGSIAAPKTLDLMRRLKEEGAVLSCILTDSGAKFVEPSSLDATILQESGTEMTHIQSARACDLVLVAPASANILAKMAHGIADDLASTTLLATDRPILIAPAMNPVMWHHPATQANIALLQARGVFQIGPNDGGMACGETGLGRMAEPEEIFEAVKNRLALQTRLAGKSALVTSGPTREAIDPVRYISNRSSGKQGHAIAIALANLGAKITLISGPSDVPVPAAITVKRVETGEEMLQAVQATLPVDIAVCAAAVSDWRPESPSAHKIKNKTPTLHLTKTPDILDFLGHSTEKRPKLVIGFAAETENMLENAKEKRNRKGCNWIIANAANAAGQGENTVYFITEKAVQDWPRMHKEQVAARLADEVVGYFQECNNSC